jgi:hypothetical protein
MRPFSRKLLSIALPLLCSACSLGSDEPTIIDGSSKARFDSTLSAAKGDLNPKERVKLELALGEFKARMFAKADNRQEYDRLVRRGLDGLTAPAIVAKFDENATQLRGDAADAVFDAKRALAKGSGPK